MKGWLDKYNDGGPVQENYNDYSVSAPEGFQGDGYSNVGRNYSPAWGGQFADGGELPNVTIRGKRQPIVVNNPNDPRLKSYKDSLSLYNKGEKNYKKRLEFNKNNNIPKSSTRKWNNPVEYHDVNKKGDIQLNKIQPIEGNGYLYNFNPDVVAGTNIPSRLTDNAGFRYKKPTQPVIYQKPEPTPQSTIDWLEGNNYPQEVIPIEQHAQPVSPYGIVTDPRTNYQYRTRNGQSEYPLYGQGREPLKSPEFAMGGSMPGAVGFTYARVAGSAPDNGKYAKKTKASAENGKEMKYYQEGLDWKPKTISKDGSQLVKLDQLTNFTNYNTKQPGGWLDKYEG